MAFLVKGHKKSLSILGSIWELKQFFYLVLFLSNEIKHIYCKPRLLAYYPRCVKKTE